MGNFLTQQKLFIMSTNNKFSTKTVVSSDLKKLQTILPSELQQWIKTNGATWAAQRRQWGNVVEDANCPLSATTAIKKIMAHLV